MTEICGEMKELYGRTLDGKLVVLTGRLVKKEVKQEEELQKSSAELIDREKMGENDNGNGFDASSVSSALPSHPSSADAIIHPQIDQPQMSVLMEEGLESTNGGDSLLDELQKLKAMVEENERALKGKELLNSALIVKLEQARKESAKEQQKNAKLAAELKLANEKLNNMDKEIEMETTANHSVDNASSPAVQPSRAVIAAQLLGIDDQLLEEELQPNEWKQKFEQLNVKYLKVKKLYWGEQKIASQLRKTLNDKERDDDTTEEQSLTHSDDFGQVEPVESNEAVSSSSPMQNKLQLTAQMRQRLLEEQMDFELPTDEDKEKEEGEEKVKELETVAARRSAKAIIVRKPATLPATERMEEKKNGAANAVATVPDGVFKCQQCPSNRVAFSSADQLARHQRRFHGVRQHRYHYHCQECGRRFRDNANLERHRRTHTGEKPHKCRQCGREFTQKNNLVTHERTHTGERPFVCSVCQRAFVDQSTQIRHARIHSGERPFSCQHCARQFRQSSDCRGHEKICPMRALVASD